MLVLPATSLVAHRLNGWTVWFIRCGWSTSSVWIIRCGWSASSVWIIRCGWSASSVWIIRCGWSCRSVWILLWSSHVLVALWRFPLSGWLRIRLLLLLLIYPSILMLRIDTVSHVVHRWSTRVSRSWYLRVRPPATLLFRWRVVCRCAWLFTRVASLVGHVLRRWPRWRTMYWAMALCRNRVSITQLSVSMH